MRTYFTQLAKNINEEYMVSIKYKHKHVFIVIVLRRKKTNDLT